MYQGGCSQILPADIKILPEGKNKQLSTGAP